jgi:hypothetical protein
VRQFFWVLVFAGFTLVLSTGCASTGSESSEAGQGQPVESPVVREEPADEPVVNTLKWTTASEVDNFGFDIYRSLNEDGPFDRITDDPLPGAGTTDEPQKYVFVDSEIDPTKDYYYYIESISLGGVREVFSPVIRSPAKRPVEDSD